MNRLAMIWGSSFARRLGVAGEKGTQVAEPRGTEAAGRVADVLLLLSERVPDPLGVSEISRLLGMPRTVVHRILQSLTDRALVKYRTKDRRYELGPAAEAMGLRVLRQSSIRSSALPVLHDLQRRSGETATVSTLLNNSRIYLAQVESTMEMKMTVELGRPYPLYAGSSGTAMLAFLPEAKLREVLSEPLPQLTSATITAQDRLLAKLAQIRADGFSCSDGERQEGVRSVAAPIFGFEGTVIGSVSVCGPASRLSMAQCRSAGPALVEAATQVRKNSGWT